MKQLGRYLIDNDVFLVHYFKRESKLILMYESFISEHNRFILFGIDITPYVFILQQRSHQEVAMFHLHFNNLLEGDNYVSDMQTINDTYTLFCYIFFFQYYFL